VSLYRDDDCVGESAGAGSVHMHMFSPLSRGLFHGAISQSGCATCFWSFTGKAPEYARKYAELFNCTGSSSDIVECLREKDATSLIAGQLAFLEWQIYPVVVFGPVLEPPHAGAFLSELPEDIYKRGGVAPVPWISGFNHDEGAINIATLFIANDTLPQLNSNWDTYGPIFLDLKNNEDNSVELSNKIKSYYLGHNQQMSYENRHQAIKMFGDRYVIACGVKGIELHARYSSHPVYSYRLAFKGKYSIVQLLGQQSKDWGKSFSR
jgi:juvenile-hormone esterase